MQQVDITHRENMLVEFQYIASSRTTSVSQRLALQRTASLLSWPRRDEGLRAITFGVSVRWANHAIQSEM